MLFEQDDANKILSRSNNILSRRNKLKNKTRMSLPGFRTYYLEGTKIIQWVKENTFWNQEITLQGTVFILHYIILSHFYDT